MTVIPFLYFSVLFYMVYRRNGHVFDIACYILAIYGVSSFFSILIDVYDIRQKDVMYYDPSLFATISYCALITISVLPFIIFSSSRIKEIKPVKNFKLFKILAIIFFVYFFIYTVMSMKTLYSVLTGDIGEIRKAHYAGFDEDLWLASWPFYMRLPFTILNYVTGCPWVLLFLGFFSIVIQKIPIKYGLMFIISSLIGFVQNFVVAGRSDIVYWLFSAGACYVFFRPYISKSIWKSIRYYLFGLVAAFVLLIGLITFSRFGENDTGDIGGAEAGFISYAGQSFVNFCFFYDSFECPQPTLEPIFPLTYLMLGQSQGGVLKLQEILSYRTSYQLGVFYTYIGQISTTSNNMVAILYCLFYSLLSIIGVKNVRSKIISIKTSFFYLVYSSVMFLGVFSHYYAYYTKTLSLILFSVVIVVLMYSTKKKSLINKKECNRYTNNLTIKSATP